MQKPILITAYASLNTNSFEDIPTVNISIMIEYKEIYLIVQETATKIFQIIWNFITILETITMVEINENVYIYISFLYREYRKCRNNELKSISYFDWFLWFFGFLMAYQHLQVIYCQIHSPRTVVVLFNP